MGRTDIDQADIASLQFIDLKETVLDRDGNDGIAAVAKDFPPQSEPRFFNADAVVFIAQQVRQYAQQRNRAGTDDDLGRRCMNAARFVNIPAQARRRSGTPWSSLAASKRSGSDKTRFMYFRQMSRGNRL